MEPILVDTPVGPGRLLPMVPPDAEAVLLLGHGAGGGVNSFDQDAVADGLPGHGIGVIRYQQPWLVAGRKVAARAPVLDEGWRPAVARVLSEYPGLDLWVGGRSAGARVACRCFEGPARGVVCLSFPLHFPGKPENSRAHELTGVDGPVLVIQGERDPFGTPDEVRAAAVGRDVTVFGFPGTHSFAPRTKAGRDAAADLRAAMVAAVLEFIRR